MLFEYFVPEIARIAATGPENNIACA